MDDRNNTIAGWVLFAGIVALGAWIVTGEMYHAERSREDAAIRSPAVEEGGAAGADAKPIEFYLASADPAKGEAGVQEMRRLPRSRTRAGPMASAPICGERWASRSARAPAASLIPKR